MLLLACTTLTDYFVSVYQFVVDYVSLYSSDKCSKLRYSTQFGSDRLKTLVVIPLNERLLVCLQRGMVR